MTQKLYNILVLIPCQLCTEKLNKIKLYVCMMQYHVILVLVLIFSINEINLQKMLIQLQS